jgi:hypothetical protein
MERTTSSKSTRGHPTSGKEHPVLNPESNSVTIQRIVLRNDRIFIVFIGVGIVVASLIVLVMIIRWNF